MKQMISVDISNDYIYAIPVERKGKGLRVGAGRAMALETPIVNSEGELDANALEEQLPKALAPFQSRQVGITYSTLPTVTNTFAVPYTAKAEELTKMVRQKVFAELSEKEYLMDYMVLGERTHVSEGASDGQKPESVRLYDITSYAIPRNYVEISAKVITSVKCKPVKFSVAHQNILALCSRYLPGQCFIIANVAREHMNLHLYNGPDTLITRSFSFGHQKQLDILGELEDASTPMNTRVYHQLSRLMQYQAIKFVGRQVTDIYLSGSGADMELCNFLQENLNVNTVLLSTVSAKELAVRTDLGNFVYAIGAGLA